MVYLVNIKRKKTERLAITMKKAIKKWFGGLDLTWPKLLIAAVIAGVFAAAYTRFIGDHGRACGLCRERGRSERGL